MKPGTSIHLQNKETAMKGLTNTTSSAFPFTSSCGLREFSVQINLWVRSPQFRGACHVLTYLFMR